MNSSSCTYSSLLVACLVLLLITIPSISTARSLLAATTTKTSANLDLLDGIQIPAAIAVPSGNELHLALRAEGHQHYTFNGTHWVLENATAKLYGSHSDAVVGRHFYLPEADANGGRPTWQSYDCPSAVTAKSLAAVTVDADSITWNLLQATSHSGNTDGPFGHVTYVQRLKTHRGLPPSTTSGVNVGDTHSSKYKAIYAFYVESA